MYSPGQASKGWNRVKECQQDDSWSGHELSTTLHPGEETTPEKGKKKIVKFKIPLSVAHIRIKTNSSEEQFREAIRKTIDSPDG